MLLPQHDTGPAGTMFCSQVQDAEDAKALYRTEILYRPSQPGPAEMYDRLGLHRKGLQRKAAHMALWAQSVAREFSAVLDRTNAMGAADCLLVSHIQIFCKSCTFRMGMRVSPLQ